MAALRLFAIACLLVLGGCTHAHAIEAVMIDGRLAFQPSPELFSHARCVSRVDVAPVQKGGTHAVRPQRLYAWLDHGGHNCVDRFPVFYGVALKGVGEGGVLGGEVLPRPLQPEVVYEVRITAGANGHGVGRFRLLQDGTVENLPIEAAQ